MIYFEKMRRKAEAPITM